MEEIPKECKKKGRTPGATQWKKYRWDVTIYDINTKQFLQGKFCSVRHMNEVLKMDLSSELVNRISAKKYDQDRKMKTNSHVDKYGHIQIKKIDEQIVSPTTKKSKRPQENKNPGDA